MPARRGQDRSPKEGGREKYAICVAFCSLKFLFRVVLSLSRCTGTRCRSFQRLKCIELSHVLEAFINCRVVVAKQNNCRVPSSSKCTYPDSRGDSSCQREAPLSSNTWILKENIALSGTTYHVTVIFHYTSVSDPDSGDSSGSGSRA